MGTVETLKQLVCTECKNSDIQFAGTLEWDYDKQEFSIVDTGEAYCLVCNKHCGVEEIE